jgi:hypothetical protein
MLKLSEDEARGLDAIYKGVGILALVLGAGWTLTQYFLHRAEERETAAIEARKPFLEKRLQVYDELVVAAATIASSGDGDEVKKAKKQFVILISGPVKVFEDQEVAKAAEDFRKCVGFYNQCQELPASVWAERLASACRVSIGEGWGIVRPLPPKIRVEMR